MNRYIVQSKSSLYVRTVIAQSLNEALDKLGIELRHYNVTTTKLTEQEMEEWQSKLRQHKHMLVHAVQF